MRASLLLILVLLLSACAPEIVPAEAAVIPIQASPSPTATAILATATSTATATTAPTKTFAPIPTITPTRSSSPTPELPPAGEKSILVRIGEQRFYAYQGQVLVYNFPVSTGRNQNTATGRFKVLDKRLNPVNPTWGYRMPHRMGVYWVNKELENGFHALPLLADGSRLWADKIGSPASDDCIVLLPEDMSRLYEWAEVGTPVRIEE